MLASEKNTIDMIINIGGRSEEGGEAGDGFKSGGADGNGGGNGGGPGNGGNGGGSGGGLGTCGISRVQTVSLANCPRTPSAIIMYSIPTHLSSSTSYGTQRWTS